MHCSNQNAGKYAANVGNLAGSPPIERNGSAVVHLHGSGTMQYGSETILLKCMSRASSTVGFNPFVSASPLCITIYF